ncbi:SDR family oxidoreductase [Lentilactobacillus kefiri]|uniref:NAD-dependent epimerase dehydratase n=2 Tax=Lentilactobacillus kefiri TaxID=33962 RepID=A0A8E1RK24_LENKE|nr:SDR family oxidoreductase [Lentilactobacillus kefiri]KRL72730.1 NAD-dependent epimerase dehydratase [Lentilactobacillus parakefiri DSM 10551]KRM52717.1 NAD-dependent epimerase dehydratase [Lentilactobacillus kefiri DSM 20587 = JCM 5818]MCJ2161374.1 SDR family oxidoreductase [Lentilactobacillus kefiri]MCP9368650.1 SDR family oxidoreductase [Lentilactobacillus kefiri]MDH5107993.1 SDR family oxidoreductase [Lentilactobacillus kefiri]
MTNVLILGANGQIAKLVEKQLLDETDDHLTLFLRNAGRLKVTDPKRETVVEGDATNKQAIIKALDGIDIVYANLSGKNIEDEAKTVVGAIDRTTLQRLIWISTLGIYDEVPGEFGKWNHQQLDGGYLQTYAAAAKVIEGSDLDYTIIRPAWLSNKDIVSYETTQKGEPFKGTEVSRKSIADFVVKIINDPSKEIRHSVGVNQPNTDGDKPSWY